MECALWMVVAAVAVAAVFCLVAAAVALLGGSGSMWAVILSGIAAVYSKLLTKHRLVYQQKELLANTPHYNDMELSSKHAGAVWSLAQCRVN